MVQIRSKPGQCGRIVCTYCFSIREAEERFSRCAQTAIHHTYLNATDVFSEGTVAKGEWQHVAISFDQDAKKVRFYINGKFDSEKDLGNTVLNQMFDLRIGHHKNEYRNQPARSARRSG